MEPLLTLFVALTALAVMTQAAVLVAIYLQSKRLAEQVERFLKETREVLAPMKTITENLRTASTNLVEIGMSAREQFKRVEHMVAETGEVLHTQLGRIDAMTRDVVDRMNSTALVVQDSFLRPAREVAAIAKGFGRGLETLLFRRQKNRVDQAHQDEELFI